MVAIVNANFSPKNVIIIKIKHLFSAATVPLVKDEGKTRLVH